MYQQEIPIGQLPVRQPQRRTEIDAVVVFGHAEWITVPRELADPNDQTDRDNAGKEVFYPFDVVTDDRNKWFSSTFGVASRVML
jgi:hypothetical protein